MLNCYASADRSLYAGAEGTPNLIRRRGGEVARAKWPDHDGAAGYRADQQVGLRSAAPPDTVGLERDSDQRPGPWGQRRLAFADLAGNSGR
jgi:hypothetical protein